MAFPDDDLSNQWVDPEFLGQVKLNARIDQKLNLLAQRLRAIGGNQLGAHQTTAQSIPASTWTLLTNMTADLDPSAAFASNAWTIPATGQYEVSGQLALAIGGTARTRTVVGISIGSVISPNPAIVSEAAAATAGTGTMASIVPYVFSFTAGQTVALAAFHDATAAVSTVITSGFVSYLRISRVS
jgi:hypothetical protein